MTKRKRMIKFSIILLTLFFSVETVFAKVRIKECYYKSGTIQLNMIIYDDSSVSFSHNLGRVTNKLSATTDCLSSIYYCYDGSNSNSISTSTLPFNFCEDKKCNSSYDYVCNQIFSYSSEKVFSGSNETTNTIIDNYTGADSCEGLLGEPKNSDMPAYYLQLAFNIIKYIAIVCLIALTTVDVVKVVFGEGKDMQKELTRKLTLRLIYVICIFFIPTIVKLILTLTHVYGDCGIS